MASKGKTANPEHEDGRRCLDEEEMREAGMELDKRGRWRIALSELSLAVERGDTPSCLYN
jgi:hypothetical protein